MDIDVFVHVLQVCWEPRYNCQLQRKLKFHVTLKNGAHF